MGLLESLTGLFQGGANQPASVASILTTVWQQSGGFDAVLTKLNASGYGEQVNSWLGHGQNMPITAQEIESALGNAQLQQFAKSMGVPLDQVAGLLAQHLPAAVDKASPNGSL